MLNYDSNRPLYRQIAEKLEVMIQADAFPDFKLPTERELKTLFKVSAATIKQSLGVLVEKDLIYRRPRLGTFIKRSTAVETHRYNELRWLRLDTPNGAEKDSVVQGISALYEVGGFSRPLSVIRRAKLEGTAVPLIETLREADLYTMNSAWARELHRLGLLKTLEVGDYSLNRNLLDPAMWDPPDQSMWAVPVSANISCLYCNLDVFEEFGLPLPTAGMTWLELGAMLQTLPLERSGHHLHRFGYVTYAARFWQTVLWQMGLEIFDADDCCLMDREENIAAISYIVEFLDSLQRQHVIDMSIDRSSYFRQHDGRDLACFVGSPRFHSLVRNPTNDRWCAVPMPTAGRLLVGATAVLAGVNRERFSDETVMSLADLLVGPRGQTLLARDLENMPVNAEVGSAHFASPVDNLDLRAFLNGAGYTVKYEEPWEHGSFLFFLLQDMFRQCVKQPGSTRDICRSYSQLANQRQKHSRMEMEVLYAQ